MVALEVEPPRSSEPAVVDLEAMTSPEAPAGAVALPAVTDPVAEKDGEVNPLLKAALGPCRTPALSNHASFEPFTS
jgi:hypothetical protein